MKKNVWKILKLAVLSLAVIVVFILLFLQCPEDKTTRETSDDSSPPVAGLVKGMTGEAEKQNLSDTLDIAKSEKEIHKSTKQLQVVGKELVQGTAEKVKIEHKTISLHAKKAHKPVLQEKIQMAVSRQTKDVLEKNTKPKAEELLAEELKVLAEKVRVLEGKVKLIFEKLKAYAERSKTEAHTEKAEVFIAEENQNLDKGQEIQSDEKVVFKYPTHVLTGGISTYKEWTGYGFQVTYAYRINNYFSLGLQGNAFFKEGKYGGDRSLYEGVRANFHIFPLLVKNSRFDLYVGGTAGMGSDDAVETFETMGYMGVSYDLSKSLGMFAEAGNIGVFGLRLKF